MKVVDYCACLRASYVIIKDGEGKEYIGMSHIPHENLHNRGEIIKPSVDNLESLVNDVNIINRSFGLSLINAISQKFVTPKEDYPEVREPICIIGNMQPLIKEFSGGKTIYVFEKSTELRNGAMSEEELFLPKCKTVFITGVTLLNFSLERILEISGGTNILIGPSAGFITELAKDFGINYVKSMKFTNVQKIKELLKSGGFFSLKIKILE
ncbi:hypothetical protein HS5_15140 [Acidianus sp. HS-5]|nr:hypothetical protein HS5_15140 [Acidianus sp. HS-5]